MEQDTELRQTKHKNKQTKRPLTQQKTNMMSNMDPT